jgi:hypothetical protein
MVVVAAVVVTEALLLVQVVLLVRTTLTAATTIGIITIRLGVPFAFDKVKEIVTMVMKMKKTSYSPLDRRKDCCFCLRHKKNNPGCYVSS